ncbi:MAG: tRNA1(Val) (adenine(37)-N6)-methyltransferase [Candidatus Izimaplasma sp.]|nr:tRNA1(Val) (adenine(37)-N6)-methyltransferase [Candidatus Izimaplasma bacterium]
MTEVINDLLGYDGLKIIQRPDMFNFSLDSTLLADFVKPRTTTKKILDLGTGNAPIPIFLSLKTEANIIGIDIQDDILDLAKRSVKLNHLETQITIKKQNIKGIHKHYENSEFDILTCNPPFFKYKSSSHINKNDYKTIARHEVEITFEEIVIEAKRLLKTNGSFYLVHRTNRLMEIIETLKKHNFAIKQLRFVYPKANANSNMVLIESSSNGKTGLKLLSPLIVHEGQEYTKEIKQIFHYGEEHKR